MSSPGLSDVTYFSPEKSEVLCSFQVPPYESSLEEVSFAYPQTKGRSQPRHKSPIGDCHQDRLRCDEDVSNLVAYEGPVYRDSIEKRISSGSDQPSISLDVSDIYDVIRNELSKLKDLQVTPELPEATRFALEYRPQIVSWLVQAISSLELTKETLHSAVSLLDRYIAGTEAHPTAAVLQLLALGCLSTAAKHEEVAQRSSEEWIGLAVSEDHLNLYECLDLHRMEWLLLDTVEWRIRVPNTLSFLRHYQTVLTARGVIPSNPRAAALFKESSDFLSEMTLIYPEFLHFSYSTVAVTCLIFAQWHLQSSGCCRLLPTETLPVSVGSSRPAPRTPQQQQQQQQQPPSHAPEAALAKKLLLELATFLELDVSCFAPRLASCVECMSRLHHYMASTAQTASELGLIAPIAARYPQLLPPPLGNHQ